MTPETISIDLKKALRRLRLSPMLDTLPERITLARQNQMPFQDLFLLVLQDEISRRDQAALTRRTRTAQIDVGMCLENWDETANVTFDRELWNELCSLRFMTTHHHCLILGPVGVGKTFLANAIGHIACRRGYTALMLRSEHMFKLLKAARLDHTYEREMRQLLRVDLLIIDDFGLDQMDATESRDFYDIVVERHQLGSLLVTSNREPQEWLSLMADPIRAQSAVDRLQNAAYELVIEGESYRKRQKPTLRTESRVN